MNIFTANKETKGWFRKHNKVLSRARSSMLFLQILYTIKIYYNMYNKIIPQLRCKTKGWITSNTLQWRHNDHDSVSNHQPHGCLLNRLFRRRSKKTSKLRGTGLCVGSSPGPVNSPHRGPVTRKMFPFDDVIMKTRSTPREHTSATPCLRSVKQSSQTWNRNCVILNTEHNYCCCYYFLIARFMGPIWGPSGADGTQVGPMLAPWTLLSGLLSSSLLLLLLTRSVSVSLLSSLSLSSFFGQWPVVFFSVMHVL